MQPAIVSAALFASLALAGQAQAGQVLDKVMSEKVLVEVTDQAYPPFSIIDDSNEVVGFDIDIARSRQAPRRGARGGDAGLEIITAGKWQGRWDICICSMTPTAERAEVLDFVLKITPSRRPSWSTPTTPASHRART